MAKKKLWMQEAAERMERKGTKGAFTRAAKAAGKTVAEYAREKASAPGIIGKRARFALIARKVARKKSRGGRR